MKPVMLRNHERIAIEERLRRIAEPVRHFWGKHFPIRVLEESDDIDVAATDFRNIYVRAHIAKYDDKRLACILAHEWAHRMVSPVSPEIGMRIIHQVMRDLEVSPHIAQLVGVPAIELIVDRANCETGPCSAFYASVSMEILNAIRSDDKYRFFRVAANDLMLALRMANLAGVDALPRDLGKHGDAIAPLLATLFSGWKGPRDKSDPMHMKKIIRFSRAFHDLLPENEAAIGAIMAMITDIERDMTGGALIPALDPSILLAPGDICIPADRQEGRHHAPESPARLCGHVTEALLRAARRGRPASAIWQLSHPVHKLDLKRSLRGHPALIPGLTTRMRREGRRPTLGHGERMRLLLIVDDSISMRDHAAFSRAICEGILRFAELRDIPMGVITFGSEIDVAIHPSTGHARLSRAIADLRGRLGSTRLQPALRRALAIMDGGDEITHVVIVTDARIGDLDGNAARALDLVRERSRLTSLIINDEAPDDFIREARKNGDDRVFQVNPARPLHTSILEEIIQ